MAHKKAGGSTRNGRDSESKRLGIKKFGGENVIAGNILVRQRGTRIVAGINLNTLADFRFTRVFRAQHGEQGQRKNCTGAKGTDLDIPMPLGTMIYDADTGDLMGELTKQ